MYKENYKMIFPMHLLGKIDYQKVLIMLMIGARFLV